MFGWELKLWLGRRLGLWRGWSFYYRPPVPRNGIRGKVDSWLTRTFLRMPGQRRISSAVPPFLRDLSLPAGVEVLGTYATYSRRSRSYDQIVVKYRWPDSVGGGEEGLSRALAAAGFQQNIFTHLQGFTVGYSAFVLDEQRILLVNGEEDGVVGVAVHTDDQSRQRDAALLPVLEHFWSDQASYRERSPSQIVLHTRQRPDADFERWCSTMRSQGWQEVGRLSAEWGRLAHFSRAEPAQTANLLLTRAADGEWLLDFGGLTVQASDSAG